MTPPLDLKAASALFATIVTICKGISLYGTKHPFVHEQTSKAVEILEKYFFAFGTREVSYHLFEEELFFESEFLAEETARFAKTVNALHGLGIGSLTFTQGLSATETAGTLSRIVEELATCSINKDDPAGLLDYSGSDHLSIGALSVRPSELSGSSSSPKKASTDEIHQAKRLYDVAVRAADASNATVREGGLPDVAAVSHAAGSIVESLLRDPDSLIGLTAIKQHNEYTAYHSVNVAILSACFAARLRLPVGEITDIARGAMLHDIGKLSLGASLIEKKTALDAEEWALMRSHPYQGAKLLSRLSQVDETAITIAYEHHLCYDLSGYPADFKGDGQHLFASLVQLADVYDGITSVRSYHNARTPHIALKLILSKAGQLFHPLLAREFANMVGLYPIGSTVRLADGSNATVSGHNSNDPLRPVLSGKGAGRSSNESDIVDFVS